MKCTHCGAENAPGSAVCANCNAPLVVGGYRLAPVVPGNGLGIASMVLGIISLALFCVWYLALPCALIGCILGGVAINQAKRANMRPSGMAVAGLVCSIVALAVATVLTIIGVMACIELENTARSLSYYARY